MSTSKKSNTADKYEIFSDIEHVLNKSGMYLGSPQMTVNNMHIATDDNKIIKKEINYIPAIETIYEEILLNAFDQSVRTETGTTEIKVTIDKETNIITVYNNGNGIDIVEKEITYMGKDMKIYVPEMIFGMLRTSSNYDDANQKRIVGGTNGYGAKLTNIFSLWFQLETVDANLKKIFTVEWKDNMSIKEQSKIKSYSKKPFTKISFLIDFGRFGIDNLSDDMIALMKKRLIDIGFSSYPNVKTYFNGENISIKTTEDYMKLYIQDGNLPTILVDNESERWSVGIMYSPSGYEQISFVNGIHTKNGGTHVDNVIQPIYKEIIEKIKKSKNVELRSNDVKNKLMIFIKSFIENPIFSSQTKESLSMSKSKFGSSYVISDKFKKKLLSATTLSLFTEAADTKLLAELNKTDGKKINRLTGIKGLEDSNHAGTTKSANCKLILTEGLSAKTFVMSAITNLGRDQYGIFPLKGKLLNVRGTPTSKVSQNEEICNVVKILGLKYGEKYQDTSSLRYGGGVIILTDADSVSGDTPILIKINEIITIINIEDLTSDYIKLDNGKEYGIANAQIWTETGWTNIKQIMRHKVSKQMYRVLTHTGCIDVTEDHSLIKSNGEEISPKDCKIGENLLHSYPKFKENMIDIPDNYKSLNVRDLWTICRQIGIQYYQMKKKDCIKSIENYILAINIELNENNIYPLFAEDIYNINYITVDESFVLGFFMADGSCDIYKWEHTAKPKNRPNSYTYIRTSYSWHLDNCDLALLNKCHKILKNIYGDVFNLVKIKKSDKGINQPYRLILNGGKSTQDIIVKYRTLCYYNKYKYIHSNILNNNKIIKQSFFDGYYAGDGRHDMSVSMKFDINGKITTQCLYHLCISLGYNVSINHCYKKNKIYSMSVNKSYSNRIDTKIKKIIKLDFMEDMYVYDLETENHHFHAGVGQLIVHNTDGTHITSLLMNFVEYFWPELLELNYIQICPTPIVKVTKKDDIMSFYTLTDFNEWKNSTKNASTYTIKYYKGLGTSTPKEAKECLKDVDTKLIKITKDVNAHSSIELAFNKDLADERKEWLMKRYNREDNINRNEREVSTSDFINKELIHFSYYDNERSLPNIVDGLKPSQRKIMYGGLKYLMNSEMKVAQFGAKVAEKTDYHHGEASLMGAIIGMAQNYMGSNNINLLEPIGGFGSRQNNSDAASPRYIFTKISELAKLLFNEHDMKLLKYNESDGTIIEPEWFIPVLPVILINGTLGIGSGFSTTVLKYNVNDIADYYISKMNNQSLTSNIDPWYRGFKGKVIRETKNKYRSEGVYKIIPDKSMIQVTELPVGVWTDDYKEYLESLLTDKNSNVKDININTSDVSIDFKIYFTTLGFKDIEKLEHNEIIKLLKLSNKLSCTNMYLFDKTHIITKYNDVFEILDYFYDLRLEYYELRKQYIIDDLKKQLMLLSNKARFVRFVKNGNIKLGKVSEKDVIIKLTNEGFDKIPENDIKYKYLTSIPFVMFTDEYIKKLEDDTQAKADELHEITKTTIKEMWEEDIMNILIKNEEINQELESENLNSILTKKNTTSKKKTVSRK